MLIVGRHMNETFSVLTDITVQPQNHKKKGSQENVDEDQLRKRLIILNDGREKQLLILRNPKFQTHKIHCLILSVFEVDMQYVMPSPVSPAMDGIFTIQLQK